jgi:hypothetical protein
MTDQVRLFGGPKHGEIINSPHTRQQIIISLMDSLDLSVDDKPSMSTHYKTAMYQITRKPRPDEIAHAEWVNFAAPNRLEVKKTITIGEAMLYDSPDMTTYLRKEVAHVTGLCFAALVLDPRASMLHIRIETYRAPALYYPTIEFEIRVSCDMLSQDPDVKAAPAWYEQMHESLKQITAEQR